MTALEIIESCAVVSVGRVLDRRDSTTPESRFSDTKRPELNSGTLSENWKRTAGLSYPWSWKPRQFSLLRGAVNGHSRTHSHARPLDPLLVPTAKRAGDANRPRPINLGRGRFHCDDKRTSRSRSRAPRRIPFGDQPSNAPPSPGASGPLAKRPATGAGSPELGSPKPSRAAPNSPAASPGSAVSNSNPSGTWTSIPMSA